MLSAIGARLTHLVLLVAAPTGKIMVMPVVTISASYGAGGSQVGPRVAERLGVSFDDPAIPVVVAERLAVPHRNALRHAAARGWVASGARRGRRRRAVRREVPRRRTRAGRPRGRGHRRRA